MSLVGPRPEIPEVLALYGAYKDEYLSVKPGCDLPVPNARAETGLRNAKLWSSISSTFVTGLFYTTCRFYGAPSVV